MANTSEFKDREEFLDGLFDHIFGTDGDVSDNDRDWFDTKVSTFFDKVEGRRPIGRRRAGKGEPTAPARRSRDRKSTEGSGYGLNILYGSKESA